MKIKVQENVSYAEMSYIIDSTKLYEEVMKRYKAHLTIFDMAFYKNGQLVETPQFTEQDIVSIYLDKDDVAWLEDYTIIYDNDRCIEAWDYIFDLCCTVEDILADGNREVIYFSNINQISRKEIEEYQNGR